jgi:hypothetical protein
MTEPMKAAKGLNMHATILVVIGAILAIIGAYIIGVKDAPYRGSGLGTALLVLGVVVLVIAAWRFTKKLS